MQYNKDVLLVGQGGGFLSVEALSGVLRALEESGRAPGYSRASSGAALFMSLYYSKGLDWVRKLVTETKPTDWVNPSLLQGFKSIYGKSNYILDNDKIKELLVSNLSIESMSRLMVSVTSLDDGYDTVMKPGTPQLCIGGYLHTGNVSSG